VILYVETSAVVSWLLGETDGAVARATIIRAEVVFASRLTVAESERALARLAAVGSLSGDQAVVLRETLTRTSAHWIRYDIGESVLARAGQAFPIEPVRTVDAVHLATALELRTAEPRLELLSFDQRIRSNAGRLGLPLLP
jgi:predicted nucleic acid-binding protein